MPVPCINGTQTSTPLTSNGAGASVDLLPTENVGYDFPTFLWLLHHLYSFSQIRRDFGKNGRWDPTNSWWRHQMEARTTLLALYEGNPPVTGGFPSQRASSAVLWWFFNVRLNKPLTRYDDHRRALDVDNREKIREDIKDSGTRLVSNICTGSISTSKITG